MSVLVDHEIEEAVRSGRLVIEPFDSALVQPSSYDVRLSREFSWHKPSAAVIDPYDRDSIMSGFEEVNGESIVLQPGQFVLGATLEKISLPADMVGQLTGKSSIGRLGVMVHVTAGLIDPGFSHPPAQLTLEIVNVGSRPVLLHAGMAIAQLVFMHTAQCAVPYSKRSHAKYNAQAAAAPSKYYLNPHHSKGKGDSVTQ